VPPQFRERAADAANQAFISGLNEILLVAAAVAITGAIAGWLLVRARDMIAFAPPAAAEPATEPASRQVPAG
jgi:hypothetical protein